MPDETVQPTVDATVTPTDAPDPTTEGLDALSDPASMMAGVRPGEVEAAPETAEETDATAEAEATDEPAGEEAGADDAEATVAAEATPATEPAPESPAPPASPANPQVNKAEEDAAAQRRLQAAQDAATRQTRLKEITTEIRKLTAVPKADRDPLEHAQQMADLLAEKDALRDVEMDELRDVAQQTRAQQQETALWEQWGEKNPSVGAKRGREILVEEYNRLSTENPGATPDQLVFAAQQELSRRVRVIEGQRRAKAKTDPPTKTAAGKVPPKPAPKPGSGKVTPAPLGSRPPAAPKTPEEMFDAAVAGKLDGFLPH